MHLCAVSPVYAHVRLVQEAGFAGERDAEYHTRETARSKTGMRKHELLWTPRRVHRANSRPETQSRHKKSRNSSPAMIGIPTISKSNIPSRAPSL
jgi:hypothetical protein